MAMVISGLLLLLCLVGILYLFRVWLQSLCADLDKPAYTLGATDWTRRVCSSCCGDESQEAGLLPACNFSGDEEVVPHPGQEVIDQEEDQEGEKEAASLSPRPWQVCRCSFWKIALIVGAGLTDRGVTQ